MTVKEKRQIITKYCNNTPCWECELNASWCSDNVINDCEEIHLDEALELIGEVPCTDKPTEPAPPKGHDPVNHPSHYTQGGMECIDEMVLIFGKEATAHFCLCNAWKYRARALYKNGEEDMQKSHWYLNKYKELMEVTT